MCPDRLLIEFCGEELVVTRRLTVGRSADLSVDDNPYLHRVVLVLERESGTWWLRNVGGRITVTVLDGGGTSSATVGPGSALALVHPTFLVRFRAGPVPYELGGTLEAAERTEDLAPTDRGPGAPTREWGRVDLNPDQRLLLVALCERRLRSPSERWLPVPPNRAAAARLGWSVNKFNRKLDHLCVKLGRAGVPGLHGDLGLLATDRRGRLVDHSVEVGLVTAADLPVLDAAGGSDDAGALSA